MITYDKIHSFRTYINTKSPRPIMIWVLAETTGQASAKMLTRYPLCNIIATTLVFKQVLSIDERSIGTPIFKVDICVGSGAYVPSILVLADHTKEIVIMCTKQYPVITSISIKLTEGLVLPDTTKGNIYGLC